MQTNRLRKLIGRRRILLVLFCLVAISAFSLWVWARDKNEGGGYLTANVERGAISKTVTATGTLEAVRTVQVGSQISGQVQAINVDYNSIVKQGQLLARIDPRTFQTQVTTERASVTSAQARLESAGADLANQEANLTQAEAGLKAAQAAGASVSVALSRATQLMEQGLIARSDFDTAKANADAADAKTAQAQAAVDQARASIRAKQAQITQSKADITATHAGLERAALNLELTNIYSPVDGVVISRNVDVGQTVAASLSAPTLFVIANDLTEMQVKASVDEADIGKITKGQAVQFTVDAYPNDVFQGVINVVRLDPQTVQNVVTYSVIIGVDNPDMKLKPGMTANISVTVDSRENVLTVPNAALRFAPAGQTQSGPKRGVWVLVDGKPQRIPVKTGVSDGTHTEISGDNIFEGQAVLTGSTQAQAATTTARPASTPVPFMGGGGRRGGLR